LKKIRISEVMEMSEAENGSEIYKQKKYFAIALDPIHIGTGGYRIGRVDNTIVREPATGIPKIPGTTIEGVCRSYAYLKAKEDGESIKLECAKGKTKDKEPCGNCRICITFGYTTKNRSLQAMALFSDARILFFPVATMVGPVWITCPMVLKDAGIEINDGSKKEIQEPSEGKFIIPENSIIKPPEGKLNFGWLLLDQDNDENKKTNVDNWVYGEDSTPKLLKDCGIHEEILKRVVIVSNSLFPQIVNSNLEVRTSVAIDPERGAAEEGALFTYEAIPRGTVFWFEVTYQNPTYFPSIPKKIKVKNNEEKNVNISLLIETVNNSLELLKYLGVGGMSSRGFGRLRILNLGGVKE
jgi:CRISPR-associated protein Cmr4